MENKMTHTEIECFLAISRYKTVSRAAEALYITQPSLSARLKTLEKELGGLLFHRKKGNREMILTAAGERFYKLALEYESITHQMLNVCKIESDFLRISAINSISTYFLPHVYNHFLNKHPECHLEIQDMELEAASKSILNGTTDLAFTTGKTTDERFIQTPVFLEPMTVIAGKDFHFDRPVSIKQLEKNKEVYVDWSRSFSAWHKKSFIGDYPQITVSIMSQLKEFIEQGGCWAIVPAGIAHSLKKDTSINIINTAFDLPSREISIITLTDENKRVKEFIECIKEVIKQIPYVHSLV